MSTKLSPEEMLVDAALTKKVNTSASANAYIGSWTYDYTNEKLFSGHKAVTVRAYAIVQTPEGTKTIYSEVKQFQL